MSWQDSWDEKCREADRLLQRARENLDEIGDILTECEGMALMLPNPYPPPTQPPSLVQ